VSVFFEVHLLEKQVRNQASESRVLKLELADARGLIDRRRLQLRATPRPDLEPRLASRLSPSMVRHHANAQRLGDLTLKSSLSAHRVRLVELVDNFSCRVSFQSWLFHIDRQQRPSRAPFKVSAHVSLNVPRSINNKLKLIIR